MYYVAVDIGCIECGEPSNVIGVFTTKEAAEEACEDHETRQEANWKGDHSFVFFAVEAIDQVNRIEYTGGLDQRGRKRR